MDERGQLAERFEQQRPYLRAVAYRTLGSLSDADDAVQDTWLRFSRSDTDAVENLRAWLTTIVSRVSLNMLRARRHRREEPIDTHVPDPLVSSADGLHPEQPVLMADSVGLALQVVLDRLTPAERLAFVLHDIFAVSFDDIAPMVDRTPTAARKLASRARSRLSEHALAPERDVVRQREIVDAYFEAAYDGDFDRLLAVLDPAVVLRTDGGTRRAQFSVVIRGAKAVSERAIAFARLPLQRKPVLVNGAAGVVVHSGGGLFSVMGFTIVGPRIAEIDILADPERLGKLDLSFLAD